MGFAGDLMFVVFDFGVIKCYNVKKVHKETRRENMKKKSGHLFLIAAVLFACWLQFPVGMHIRETVPGATATCTESGLTEGKVCILCGKEIVAQKVIPATGLHTYDNDFDESCKDCPYVREPDSKFNFVNYRAVLIDENVNHKNLRVVVYNLRGQTIEDPSDEDALQAVDSDAKIYWGVAEINRILLTDPGNYVLLLKYNVGKNLVVKVPLAVAVNDDPKLVVDGNNRITVVDNDAANKNHTLTVYDLGNATATDPNNEADVAEAAINTQSYTGIDEINNQVLTKGGNYVLYLRYETADGTQQTIILPTTLENSRPNLSVDAENRLVVTCEDENVINFRAFVYYLGDQTVLDIYDEVTLEDLAGKPEAYWGLKRISQVQLQKPGTYVIYLHYNIGTGPKQTVVTKLTV